MAESALPPTLWRSILINAIAIGSVWVALGILLSLLSAAGLSDEFELRKVVDLVALSAGVMTALLVRARFATFALAGWGVAVLAETIFDVAYGVPSIRGAVPHFALIVAGLAGVAAGAILARNPSPKDKSTNAETDVADTGTGGELPLPKNEVTDFLRGFRHSVVMPRPPAAGRT
jgi:hypothetical protein